ncbi:hypothetical protein MLD38_038194 [Melastoma candidum]|uniref:Uncharacterized protein n=1 Tax=Melastoma candidum TaxID=119954 RepID=A0ACB9KZB4_9MYRT|nr:hypothetical protein MLD38_038194 [Melastoma candidum]
MAVGPPLLSQSEEGCPPPLPFPLPFKINSLPLQLDLIPSSVGGEHAWMSRERERFDETGIAKIKRDQGGGDAFATNYMGRRHMLGPPGTLNTVTPCAACKLLRRRCAQECPFSPYFSPHEPQKFASVHKVFGASNVSKMLMEVPESQRADAANSLVYEANVRLRDPVYGCMGAISALQQQVQNLQAELNILRGEILKYKYREAAAAGGLLPSSHHQHLTLFSSEGAVSVAVPPPSTTQAPHSQPQPQQHQQQQQQQPPPLPNSTSPSSAFTRPGSSAATDYSTITSENASYFG